MTGETGWQGLGTAAHCSPGPAHSSLRGFSCLSCSPELLNLVISVVLGGGLAEALGGDRGSGSCTVLTERHAKPGNHIPSALPSRGWALLGVAGAQWRAGARASLCSSGEKFPRLWLSSPSCVGKILLFGGRTHPYPGPTSSSSLSRLEVAFLPTATPQPGKCWWGWG